MISTRFTVPIESHTQDRSRPVAEPTPDVGISWGQASEFSIINPPSYENDEASEGTDDSGTGMTTRLWPEEIWTERTYRMSPVWRAFDIARLKAENDPETTLDVAVTTYLLFPIRSQQLKYTGGGSYVEDTEGLGYELRTIHSFVLLKIPSPSADWEIVQRGLQEGQWPNYPDETFAPGGFL